MKFKLKDASATDIERLSTLIAKAMSPSIKEILAAFKTEEGNFICTDFLTPGRTVSLPMDLDPNTDLAPLKQVLETLPTNTALPLPPTHINLGPLKEALPEEEYNKLAVDLISAFPYLIEYEEGEEPPIYHKPTPPKAGDMKPIDYANIVRQFASTLSKSMSMIMEAPSQTLTAAGIEGTVPKFTITKYLENSYIQVDSTKRLVGLQGVIPQDEFEQLKQYLAEQYNLSLSVSQIFSQNPEVKISVFNTLVTKFAEAAKTSAAETNTLGTPFIVYKVPRNFDDVFKCIDSIKLNWAAKNYAKRVVIEGYEPKEALLCAINILRDNPWFKFEIEIRYKNPDISGSLLVNVRGGNSLGQFVNRLDVAILKHLAPFLDTPTKVMIANNLNPTQYGDDVLDNLLAGAEDIFSQIKSSGRASDYALRNMKTVPNPIPRDFLHAVLSYYHAPFLSKIPVLLHEKFMKQILLQNPHYANQLALNPEYTKFFPLKNRLIAELGSHNTTLTPYEVSKVDIDEDVLSAVISSQNTRLLCMLNIPRDLAIAQNPDTGDTLAHIISKQPNHSIAGIGHLLQNLLPGDFFITNQESLTPLESYRWGADEFRMLYLFINKNRSSLEQHHMISLIRIMIRKAEGPTEDISPLLTYMDDLCSIFPDYQSDPAIIPEIIGFYCTPSMKPIKHFRPFDNTLLRLVSAWERTITPEFIKTCVNHELTIDEVPLLQKIASFLVFFTKQPIKNIVETLLEYRKVLSQEMLNQILGTYVMCNDFKDYIDEDTIKLLVSVFKNNTDFLPQMVGQWCENIISHTDCYTPGLKILRKDNTQTKYQTHALNVIDHLCKITDMTLQDMRFDTVLCDTNGKKEIKAGLLYAAIREGRFHIAHYLIEHGARYCSEELPLMVAIAFFCDPRKDLSQNDQIAHPKNRAEFAEFVLKKYPGILMESMYDGDTAAHVCCYSPKPNFPLMQVLLKSEELDINPRNKSGQTPLDILLSNITNNTGNWSNILETFVAMVLYRPKIPDVIQVPKIRELLNKMNTKKQKKTLTETPQKVEEASAAPALTKLYISDANKAVLVDRVDESGMTAMHAACLLPREKIHNIMLELLRIGCNQFDALFEGQTVLDMMLASVSNPEDLDPEIQGVIDVLVQQGAHCNPKYNTVFWASKIKPEAFVEQPTQDAQAAPDVQNTQPTQDAQAVPDLNAMGNAADAPPDHI